MAVARSAPGIGARRSIAQGVGVWHAASAENASPAPGAITAPALGERTSSFYFVFVRIYIFPGLPFPDGGLNTFSFPDGGLNTFTIRNPPRHGQIVMIWESALLPILLGQKPRLTTKRLGCTACIANLVEIRFPFAKMDR